MRDSKSYPTGLSPLGASKRSIMEAASNYAKRHLGNGLTIEALVQKLGGKITYLGPSDIDRRDEESILIRREGDFEIFLPPHTSVARDRFTIAHELGHYLLQYGEKDGPKHAGRSMGPTDDRVEWEANWFAAGLLMPEDEFKEAIEKYDSDYDKIARQFGVSKKAAEIRAQDLRDTHQN